MKKFLLLFVIAFVAMDFSGFLQIQAETLKAMDYVIVYSTQSANAKYTYSYDEFGNYTLRLGQSLVNESWEDKNRFTISYNEGGYKLSSFYENYSNGSWVPYQRESYTYNESNQLLLYKLEYFSGGIWLLQSKQTNTYDEDGKLLTYNFSNFQNGKLSYYTNQTMSYGSNGLVSERITEMLYSGKTYKSRFTYTYDENENMISSITENDNNGIFELSYKSIFEYNEHGDNTLELLEQRSGNDWIPYQRTTLSYDYNFNLLLWLQESWEVDKYLPVQKEVYTYNKAGKQLTYYYLSWTNGVIDFEELDSNFFDPKGNLIEWKWMEKVGETWENRDRRTYTYDAAGNMLTFLSENWVAGQWANKNINYLSFTSPNEKISNTFIGYKMELAYKNITGVNDGELDDVFSINIFPNPATDFIEIGYDVSFLRMQESEISIHNTLGECVLQVEQTLSPVQRIDVSVLPAGIYFLKVDGETKKFIKL